MHVDVQYVLPVAVNLGTLLALPSLLAAVEPPVLNISSLAAFPLSTLLAAALVASPPI